MHCPAFPSRLRIFAGMDPAVVDIVVLKDFSLTSQHFTIHAINI